MIRKLKLFYVLIPFLFFIQSSSAEKGPITLPVPSDAVLRISVDLVQIDAVVTDSKGRYIIDLRAEDFEVLQDGKRQPITHFGFFSAALPLSLPDGSRTKDTSLPVLPAPSIDSSRVLRSVAIVVDDASMSFSSIKYVHEALYKFIREQIQPNDLVAIIRTNSNVGVLQQFTTDKRILNAAIKNILYHPWTHRDYLSDSQSEGETPQRHVYARNALGVTRYVLRGLSELPGRKSVILFSENMQLSGPFNPIQEIVDLANRASTVVYTVDPRGLMPIGYEASDPYPGATSGPDSVFPGPYRSNLPVKFDSQVENRLTAFHSMELAARSREVWFSREGLNLLAEQTGGLFFRDNNDLDHSLKRILEDQQGYYLLGYRPDTDTFDEKTGQAKFHSLKVRLKRKGLTVRSRRSFKGVSDQERHPSHESGNKQLVDVLVSPFRTVTIPLNLTAHFLYDAAGGPFINSMVHIDAKSLSFIDDPDPKGNAGQGVHLSSDGIRSDSGGGESQEREKSQQSGLQASAGQLGPDIMTSASEWKKAVIEVMVVAFDGSGEEINNTNRIFTLRMRGATLKEVMDNGLVYTIRHPLKRPGAFQLRVAVRDTVSHRVGSASQFMEVPDIARGQLALSSVIMNARTPDPSFPAGNSEERTQTVDPRSGPVLRIFKAGQAVDYGFEIINARRDAAGKIVVSYNLRLLQGEKIIYQGDLTSVDVPQQGDPKYLIVGGGLKLDEGMEAGDYILQVIVRDHLVEKLPVSTNQFTTFKVEPGP